MEIFITDLEAYNNGHLVGKWITLPLQEDQLHEELQSILIQGKNICSHQHDHEEIFITDYEFDISIDEYDNISRLNELASMMETLDDHDLLKLMCLSHV